jgi:hypothetical protein
MIHGGTWRGSRRATCSSSTTAPASSSRTTPCAPPAPRSPVGSCAGEPVDPAEVYFRGQVTLETGDPRWSWLNERQFLCVGQRLPTQVLMSFYIVQ